MTVRKISLRELCELTIQAIDAEPQNYYQDTWETGVSVRAREGLPTGRNCGTAYCVGGWMARLTGTNVQKVQGVLHYNHINFHPLFAATALWKQDGSDALECQHRPGTREYAAEGIAHIRKWMSKQLDEKLDNTMFDYNPDGWREGRCVV